jgi:hypothetical protein
MDRMSNLLHLQVSSTTKLYVACALLCGSGLTAAIVAFHASGPILDRASANGLIRSEQNHRTADLLMDHPASARGNGRTSTVMPVVISRVPTGAVDETLDTAQPVMIETTAAPVETLSSSDGDEWAGYEPWTPGRSDTYRTVCVRLCDGAFFPISFSTTRIRFKMDAARCQTSCGQPAQLFVSKQPAGDTEDLVDVHGAAYVDLPNAFKFRTSYDPSCSCRGQPWEQVAQDRHRQLAEAAQAQNSTAPQTGSLAASAAVDRSTTAMTQPKANAPSTATIGMTTLLPLGPTVEVKATEVELARHDTAPARHLAASDPDAPQVKPKAKRVVVAALHRETAVAKNEADDTPAKPAARPAQKSVAAPAVPRAAAPSAPAKQPPLPSKPPQKVAAPAARPTPPKPATYAGATRATVARADGAARAQRAFKSNDYWRLSFWEPRN